MIIGIDFGTTKSVACVIDGGTPSLVCDRKGRTRFPSVVRVAPDGRLHACWEAVEAAPADLFSSQQFTINSVKRLLGRAGRTRWGSYKTHPQEISALILGRLKIEAELFLGEEVSEAVIAVPAHFNINQRWATMQAAKAAGLKVRRLLNEASAAAMAYCARRRDNAYLAVVDLGGGTLDISIINYGIGVLDTEATEGDTQLGGDDFDQVLADYMVARFREDHGVDLRNNTVAYRRILEAAEGAKRDLSVASKTTVRLPAITRAKAKWLDLSLDLRRDVFEDLARDLLERCRDACTRCLRSSDTSLWGTQPCPVLVGGSSRMPAMRNLVQDVFGEKPDVSLDAQHAVAEGAAIMARILESKERELLLLDAAPRTYSVVASNDVVVPLVRKNSTIPAFTKGVFSTASDNQSSVGFRIVEGEGAEAKDNDILGTAAPRGIPQIEIEFKIDAGGNLEVEARHVGTGRSVCAKMVAPYSLNQAQMALLRRKVREALAPVRRNERQVLYSQLRSNVTRGAKALASHVGFLTKRCGSYLRRRYAIQLVDALSEIDEAVRSGSRRELHGAMERAWELYGKAALSAMQFGLPNNLCLGLMPALRHCRSWYANLVLLLALARESQVVRKCAFDVLETPDRAISRNLWMLLGAADRVLRKRERLGPNEAQSLAGILKWHPELRPLIDALGVGGSDLQMDDSPQGKVGVAPNG